MEDTRIMVNDLLKSYREKKKKIVQLRFELEHQSLINARELIEGLSLNSSSPVRIGSSSDSASDRTLMIALQYQDIARQMNEETMKDIIQDLLSLESEISRLEHYTAILKEPQSSIIRLLYFEGKNWSEVEGELNITKSAILYNRREAIKELTAMYSYLDGFKRN